jgi:hypothetical protein
MRVFVLALLLSVGGCADPCAEYCDLDCACRDDGSDACRNTCAENVSVYAEPYRADECAARLDLLEEECR